MCGFQTLLCQLEAGYFTPRTVHLYSCIIIGRLSVCYVANVKNQHFDIGSRGRSSKSLLNAMWARVFEASSNLNRVGWREFVIVRTADCPDELMLVWVDSWLFDIFSLCILFSDTCPRGVISVVEPEPVKKFRLRAVAVWLRGTVVAK